MIMPQLLLQKTSKKSKCRDNAKTLERRMQIWEAGNLEELLNEGRTLQKRQRPNFLKSNEIGDVSKKFSNLMHKGKISSALKLLDDNMVGGALPLNNETLLKLKEKHPDAQPAQEITKLNGPIENISDVIFEEINGATIRKAAISVKGASGPSGFDADGWRRILTSRNFGAASLDLCNALALMARKLCTIYLHDSQNLNNSLEAFIACKLIPIDKVPGIRPIGIGEVLRRIIGKSIMSILREDVMNSAGPLQLCAGQRAGCEAAIHAMKNIFEQLDTEAVILVDASNAFNSLNRQSFLHNVSILCPTISIYIRNCYTLPARLFITGGKEILSSEGTTQGDPVAMAIYALAITPLLKALKENGEIDGISHEAFADDISCAGKVIELRKWWDCLERIGPFFGYFTNASKTWIICKENCLDEATDTFRNTNISITSTGQRHLGAVIGDSVYKEVYVKSKVDECVSQIIRLSEIAKIDPHSAFSAFTLGLKNKWTYVMRTVPNISNLLAPLEKAIKDCFIPALLGFSVSEQTRNIFSLPSRLGGLGIINPVEISNFEYLNSVAITSNLVSLITNQKQLLYLDEQEERKIKSNISKERESKQKDKLQLLRLSMNEKEKRANDVAQEKGASNWLTALPITELGFNLNKQEFRDGICLRYGFQIMGIPNFCACGASFSVEHSMICKKGGFISLRHNELRDITAGLLKEVCHDVELEPQLLDLNGEHFHFQSAIISQDSRLDISARGFWVRGQRAFFDTRVFYPFAQSYRNQSLSAVHLKHECEKRRQYGERVLQIEMGSFTPLVFSSSGGMAPECVKFFDRLCDLLADKRKENKSLVTAWMRCRLSFSLLRSAILCLRGSRSVRQNSFLPLEDTDFDVSVAAGRLALN